jgi:hypothetical protein
MGNVDPNRVKPNKCSITLAGKQGVVQLGLAEFAALPYAFTAYQAAPLTGGPFYWRRPHGPKRPRPLDAACDCRLAC